MRSKALFCFWVVFSLVLTAGTSFSQAIQDSNLGSAPQKTGEIELSIGETFFKEFEMNGIKKSFSLAFNEVQKGGCIGNEPCNPILRMLAHIETDSALTPVQTQKDVELQTGSFMSFDNTYGFYLSGLTEQKAIFEEYIFTRQDTLNRFFQLYEMIVIDPDIGGTHSAVPVPGSLGPVPPERPLFKRTEVLLRAEDSFVEEFWQNGIQKTIKTTFKGFSTGFECFEVSGSESGCGQYRKIVLEYDISPKESVSAQNKIVLDEHGAGKSREFVIPEQYGVERNFVFENESVLFSFFHVPTNETSEKSETVQTEPEKPTVTPEEALQNLQTNEKITCSALSLVKKTSEFFYECTAKQKGKLFGFLPIEVDILAKTDASQGTTSAQKPFWTILMWN